MTTTAVPRQRVLAAESCSGFDLILADRAIGLAPFERCASRPAVERVDRAVGAQTGHEPHTDRSDCAGATGRSEGTSAGSDDPAAHKLAERVSRPRPRTGAVSDQYEWDIAGGL